MMDDHDYYKSRTVFGAEADSLWIDMDDRTEKHTHLTLSDSHRTAAVRLIMIFILDFKFRWMSC